MDEPSEQEETLGDHAEKDQAPPKPKKQPKQTRERPVPHESAGYLLKLKHRPTTFSSWNKRFFKVDAKEETLSYYKSQKEAYEFNSTPSKVFKLSHISKVHSVDNSSFQIIFKGSSETVLFLRASSEPEKLQWVHHLHLFIRELTGYANWLCLSNLTVEPVIKEHSGFLYKLKRTPTTFSTSWNKRFFKINTTDKTLEYFNKQPSSDDTSRASDRRVIDLDDLVEVRIVDPWTFQLEVRDKDADADTVVADAKQDKGKEEDPETQKRVASLQLRCGGMNYFCLQAKTPSEQIEWRSIIENYVAELIKYKGIKSLERRALDHRRSVTHNAIDVELERVMHATIEENI